MVSIVISFADNINEHPSVVVIHDFVLGSNRLHIWQSIQGYGLLEAYPLKFLKAVFHKFYLVHS